MYLYTNPVSFTYSNYGLSLRYPADMTVTEMKTGNMTLSQTSGELGFVDDEHLAIVMWEVSHPGWTPSSAVSGSITGMMAGLSRGYPGITLGSLGGKVNLTRSDGGIAVVQHFTWTYDGDTHWSVSGSWLDGRSPRVYGVLVISFSPVDSSGDADRLFNFFESMRTVS